MLIHSLNKCLCLDVAYEEALSGHSVPETSKFQDSLMWPSPTAHTSKPCKAWTYYIETGLNSSSGRVLLSTLQVFLLTVDFYIQIQAYNIKSFQTYLLIFSVVPLQLLVTAEWPMVRELEDLNRWLSL